MYCWKSDPPRMAQMGTTTFCLLYPSLSIWTMVTSSFLAVGIKIALLIRSLWPGLTLGSFSSSSLVSEESSGAQVFLLNAVSSNNTGHCGSEEKALVEVNQANI